MKRLTVMTGALLLGAAGFATGANAAIMDTPVPGNALITVGTTEWAWAGPCAPFAPSCGEIDLSYQAGQGWRLPTIAEMDAAVAMAGGATAWANLFLYPGANWAAGTNNPPGGGLTRTNNLGEDFACASQWFSNDWTHCDHDNAVSGYIYNWSGGQPPNSAEETFVLRTTEVPVPAALPLLGTGLALMAGLMRRRAR